MENSVENMHPDFRAERVNLAIDWHPTQWELEVELFTWREMLDLVILTYNISHTCSIIS